LVEPLKRFPKKLLVGGVDLIGLATFLATAADLLEAAVVKQRTQPAATATAMMKADVAIHRLHPWFLCPV
jgi:hypothetical protein